MGSLYGVPAPAVLGLHLSLHPIVLAETNLPSCCKMAQQLSSEDLLQLFNDLTHGTIQKKLEENLAMFELECKETVSEALKISPSIIASAIAPIAERQANLEQRNDEKFEKIENMLTLVERALLGNTSTPEDSNGNSDSPTKTDISVATPPKPTQVHQPAMPESDSSSSSTDLLSSPNAFTIPEVEAAKSRGGCRDEFLHWPPGNGYLGCV